MNPSDYTVLIVDDQQPMRKFVFKMLARKGYGLLEAARADQALEMAQNSKIDLLITDVKMPGISGPELAAKLFHEGCLAHCILMSGCAAETVNQTALPKAVPFLRKPFTPDQLLNTVEAVLQPQ